MYQAFYRKYRPRRFSDVAGQEHITETLRRQIINGRLSHAYLFVGTRGTGKTSCAKILSRAVNCMNIEEGEPCNKCISCIGIEDGSILDVLELDAASNNSVDNVRALRDEAIYSPAAVKKRVYIIDEVHMLSLSAFNALLKILEEPPEHILFILATTELHKVPATIQGRCQKFSFKRMSPAALTDRLNKIAECEKLTLTDDAVVKLAILADGSMRDGISLLDQCVSDDVIDLERIRDTLGLAGQQELLRLIETTADYDVLSALNTLGELYDDGRDMASLLNEMASLYRDLLVFKISPGSGLLISTGFDQSVLSALSDKLTPERLFFCLDVLKSAISVLSRGGSSRLAVEMCLIKMCDERLADDNGALLSRISRLETGASIAPAADTAARPVKSTEKPPVDLEPPVDDPVTPAAVMSDITGDPPPPVKEESDGFWADILKLLKSEPSVHALLSDSSKVQVQKKNDELVISVTDFFTANSVESEFSALIKDAAFKVLGKSVSLRVEVVDRIDNTADNHKKLESLSAFGIVNFE